MGQKAVFFDIDGTIFEFNKGTPDNTREAIHRLRENGHLAFISTGRSLSYISEDILDVGFDGVLAGCGTYISYKGKELDNVRMDQEGLREALAFFEKIGIYPILEGWEWLYFDFEAFPPERSWSKVYRQRFQHVIKPLTGHVGDFDCNKLTLFIKNAKEAEMVIDRFDGVYHIVNHDNEYMELMPLGYSKATSIKKIEEYLHLANEDMYAIGDSNNDLEMFEACGTAICMGNGSPKAKEAADFVTADMFSDGITIALKEYGLI